MLFSQVLQIRHGPKSFQVEARLIQRRCVPSTEKCSSDKKPWISLRFNGSARNLGATSASPA
jgi:hypothetical protein